MTEVNQSDGRAHEQEWSSGPARIPRLTPEKRQLPFTVIALWLILFIGAIALALSRF